MNIKLLKYIAAYLVLFYSMSFSIISDVEANEPMLEFTSGESRVNLVELYTSEGCSSCPPADRWMSKLKQRNDLWTKFVPVTFHVDYWDYLGWKDVYANPLYTKRQSFYADHRAVSSVYTPAIILNGAGWRSWRLKNNFPANKINDKPGILKSNIKNGSLFVDFSPNGNYTDRLILNVALLGTNLKSNINAGENKGEVLVHDFVVLSFLQKIQRDNHAQWQIDNLIKYDKNKPTAIAVWVSKQDDPTPIQATGSWLY